MSVPIPPFHSVAEELLYNIYLKLQSGGGSDGLTTNDINTLAKLNAILTDADLLSSQEVSNLILALRGNVPVAGDTLEKLYNLIVGLNYLTQQDIDTIAELNAIINDADVARTSDIDAILDNVPEEANSLNKLLSIIRGTTESPPYLFLDFDIPTPQISLGSFNNGGGLGGIPGHSTLGVDLVENCFGVMRLSTGTSTAGGGLLSTVFSNIVLGLNYKIEVIARLALETLSDDLNSYLVYYGLGSAPITNLNPPHGVFFRYNHLNNGGRWQAVCRQGGIETAVDTGFVANINSFNVFRIVINPEGTVAEFFIEDMNTPVATIIENIPNASQGLILFGKIEKTVGATVRNLHFDYIKYIPSRVIPRRIND